MSKHNRDRRETFHSISIGVAVIGGLVLSFLAWHFAAELERQRNWAEFERKAVDVSVSLSRTLDEMMNCLESVSSLYAASDSVTRKSFGQFVGAFLADHPAIQAMEWIPRVERAERDRFEKLAQADGLWGFQFTQREKGGRMERRARTDEYFPVYYVEPLKGNEAAVGFDLASNQTRLRALHRSRDSGRPVATARITLVQEKERQNGFLIFWPIYGDGPAPESKAGRRAKLEGFALGVFRIADLVEASTRYSRSSGYHLSVYDLAASEDQQFLYSNQVQSVPENLRPGESQAQSFGMATEGPHHRALLDVGGRSWAVITSPAPDFAVGNQSLNAVFVLVAGLTLTALLAAYLVSRRKNERRLCRLNESLQQRVAERTAELAAANMTLQMQANELEESNQELDDFAYVASHDLKEPLRGISNYSTFLVEDYGTELDEEGRRKLETLVKLAGKMKDLIDSLLHYSRVGRIDLAVEETDLNPIVDEIVDSLRFSLEEKGVDVRIPKPLPPVLCDRVRIGEVFRNLVSNGIKYNNKDQPWIEIGYEDNGHTENGREERRAALSGPVFYVRDNGIGIDPRHLEKIFKIFSRLHSKDKYGGGTGAGLTIVKKILERHGGTISVDSEPGEGTTFHFTLGTAR